MSHELPILTQILIFLRFANLVVITNGNTSLGTLFTFSLSQNPIIGLYSFDPSFSSSVFDPKEFLFAGLVIDFLRHDNPSLIEETIRSYNMMKDDIGTMTSIVEWTL